MKKEVRVPAGKSDFAGDQKVGRWVFSNWEKKFVDGTVHLIPNWLETYHLTLMTLVWSAVVAFAGYLAKENINWMWLVSAMIAAQYLTDLFDGSVGRKRGTGLVKWGYFMDHFLDYVFLCSILFSWAFLLPPELYGIGFFFALVGIGIMMNFYLLFATTNQFKISYLSLGPTEMRLAFIVFNALIIFFGPEIIFSGLPYLAIFFSAILVLVVCKSHSEIWKIDMENKRIKDN